jgi:hypothetical protein
MRTRAKGGRGEIEKVEEMDIGVVKKMELSKEPINASNPVFLYIFSFPRYYKNREVECNMSYVPRQESKKLSVYINISLATAILKSTDPCVQKANKEADILVKLFNSHRLPGKPYAHSFQASSVHNKPLEISKIRILNYLAGLATFFEGHFSIY